MFFIPLVLARFETPVTGGVHFARAPQAADQENGGSVVCQRTPCGRALGEEDPATEAGSGLPCGAASAWRRRKRGMRVGRLSLGRLRLWLLGFTGGALLSLRHSRLSSLVCYEA